MNLAVDIGNNQSKIGVFRQEESEYFKVFQNLTTTDLGALIDEFKIERVILSDVSGFIEPLESYLEDRTQLLVFTPDTPVPVNNLYRTPETLGRDRLAAVVGARLSIKEGDIMVVDAGTSITYEILTKNNDYLGGGISPGITTRFQALEQFTGKLPLVWARPIDFLFGATTEESILSGVINGTIAEVDGMIDRYRTKYPEVKIVLTGGDAKFFENKLKNAIFAVPNLVLHGLNKILIYNA